MEYKKNIDVEEGFIFPNINRFTIYSKSGCHYCLKLKNFLKQKKIDYDLINCDDILIENRYEFLNIINNLANCEIKGFPIVFNLGQYIGGYNEAKKYVEEILLKQEISSNIIKNEYKEYNDFNELNNLNNIDCENIITKNEEKVEKKEEIMENLNFYEEF